MMKTFSKLLGLLLTFTSPASAGFNSWTTLGPETAIISSFAINPNDSLQVFAGTNSGKIFKSSDGGSNWTLAANLPEYSIDSIVIDQIHNGTAYAAGSVVYKSVDAGATWNAVGGGQSSSRINGLAISKEQNSTLYASSTNAGVYASTSGGATWTAINSGLPNSPYLNNLTVNSSGGLFVIASGQIYRRLSGDTSWTLSSAGMSISDTISTFAIDPLQQTTLYAVTSSGTVYKTTNNGNSWLPVTPQWPVSDIEYISVSPLSSNIIYCFSYYGGFSRSIDGGLTWTMTSNNGLSYTDYFTYVVDPNNPLIQFAGGNGDLYRTTSGGTSWSKIMKGLVAPNIDAMGFVHGTTNDILVGTGSGDAMYRSSDNGVSWSSSATGLPDFISILTIAVRPDNEQVVYTGYNDLGGISRSSDGGKHWSPIYTNLPVNNAVNTVVIAPSESTKIYLSCYGSQSIFRSSNGGDSWTAIGGSGLPASVIPNSLAIDTLDSSIVFLEASGNIYKSTDSGDSWTPLAATGLPAASSISAIFIEPVTGNLITTVRSSSFTSGSWINTYSVYRLVNGTWSPLANNFVGTNRISSIFTDKLNVGHYYIGVGPDVYRSNDAGVTWQKLPYPGLNDTIEFLSIHQNNDLDIFAVTSNGELFRLSELENPTSGVPGAPTGISAIGGNAQAVVSFTAPASNGGSAITSFLVTSSPGNLTAIGTASPITVTGLTNGTSYTFVVTATNATGAGTASSASGSIIPAAQKPGDCNNDGTVTIAEVQSAINMFLGLKTMDVCVDQDGVGGVSIAEVQKVINSFLGL